LKLNEYQYRSRRNDILSEEQIPMQSGGFSPSSIPPIYYHHQLHPYSNYKIRIQNQEKTAFSTDSTERIILQPLRMVREFKQLLDDIFSNSAS
jgi:polyhydroxyalkanoate synthesis regulator protein